MSQRVIFTIIMSAFSLLFFIMGHSIYRGKIELIHDYHRTKVKDKNGYCKAFGKCMHIMGIFLLSGALVPQLHLTSLKTLIGAALAVILTGFVLFLVFVCKVQKKYNGGLF